jgi:hypothetical protein
LNETWPDDAFCALPVQCYVSGEAPDTLGYKALRELRYKAVVTTVERFMTTRPKQAAAAFAPARRLLAMLIFLAGGFAAEMAHPLQCSLVNVGRVRLTRREE